MAQEKKEVKNLLSVRHDNDFLLDSDRYYSFGTFLNYSRLLESDFLFKKTDNNTLQLNFTLKQQGFTPDELDEFEVEVFDYPFSGWLSITSELKNANARNSFGVAVELGVTGDASLAGQLQRWYHRFLNIGDRPTWVAAIPGDFLINLKASYAYEIPSLGENIFLGFLSSGALGTKDIFLEQEVLFSFGKRNELNKTSLFNYISDLSETYGYIGASYRYVNHNTLIEGNLFNNDAPFTLNARNNLFKIRAGVHYGWKQNAIRLEYNLNTRETSISRGHDYTSFIFERRF